MNAQKIGILFLAMGCLLMAKSAFSSDMDEIIGKRWQRECKNDNRSLLSCCTEKGRECKDEAKNAAEEKSCKNRFKACKVESFRSEGRSAPVPKIPK